MNKPAKAGSPLHRKRISEGLIEYHKHGKKKSKLGAVRNWLAKRKHPANLRFRKLQSDSDLKKARKELRKAEGDMAAAKTLTKEQRDSLRARIKLAKEKEERAFQEARRKYED